MSDYSYFDHSAERIFNEHLSSDEKIIWAGKPEANMIFSQEDIFMIPLSLIVGFPVFLLGTSIITTLPDDISPIRKYFIIIFTVLAMLVGFYIIIGRFIYKVLKRKRTFYVVTDKRILWISGLFTPHFQDLYIDQISDINKQVSPVGIGTLKFSRTGTVYTDVFSGFYTNTGLDILSKAGQRYVFIDIKDAEKVYSIITELMGSKEEEQEM